MGLLEELLGFFLSANDETRRNVNALIKVGPARRTNHYRLSLLLQEAINSAIRLDDHKLVIELLEFLQNDKKIKENFMNIITVFSKSVGNFFHT